MGRAKSKAAWESAVQGIAKSLAPLVFRELDDSGIPLPGAFKQETILETAGTVCKLSGLLVQAHWYWLRSQGTHEQVPKEFDRLVLQIWAGYQKYDELLSTSVLQYAAAGSNSSSLRDFVKNPQVLYEWGSLLRVCRAGVKARINEFRRADWYDLFARLIESLPILAIVEYDGESLIFPWGRLPKFPYLHQSEKCRYTLFLHAFEEVNSRPVVVFENPHSDYTEELELHNEPDLEYQYSLIRQVLGFESVNQGVIHLFDAYRYIQNLAQAIANTPSPSLDAFIDNCKTEEYLMGIQPRDGDGSNLVTVALAEHGPTNVLKALMESDLGLYKRYLSQLESMGVLGSLKAGDWEKEYEQRKKKARESARGFLDIAPETLRKREEKRIDMEAKCWSVVSAAGLELDSPSDYVESIGMRIQILQSLARRYNDKKDDLWSVGIRAAKLIERTLKFLICFYSGLQAYYVSFRGDEHNISKHEASMVSQASATYDQINTFTPGKLIETFRELTKDMSRDITLRLLGRRQICDLDKFNKLTGARWVELADSINGGVRTDITAVMNRVKHDKIEPSREEFQWYLSQTIKLLKFIRDGRELADDLSFRERLHLSVPVYPAVVCFREQHRKRHGLVICNYEAYSIDWQHSEEAEDLGVKILSLHEYAPHEEYYCIPFKRKTTREWFLDPFLVSCNKLTKALSEGE